MLLRYLLLFFFFVLLSESVEFVKSDNCDKSVVVDQSGNGNFKNIQSAIDSVPSDNQNWYCINIKTGIYREKVIIPPDKQFIMLKGEGKRRTQIVWGDHAYMAQSATFTSLADNIIIKRIRFVNSYNYPKNNNQIKQAVAAVVFGDKTSFYRCGFASYQDTLWDQRGRHYFKKCTVQGAVDFIFGGGQSIYDDCSIQVVGNGFITAQGRQDPSEDSGYVFKNCKVYGYGTSYLGRPWRDYSRVIFYQSNFTDVVNPQGWDPWNTVGNENKLTFAEWGNYGPGASTSKRVKWAKKLSPGDLNRLTSMSYINSDNWLQKQPI